MYFLFFKLHCQSKRSAAQPQMIFQRFLRFREEPDETI